ncbi:hypothetical protein ACLM5H_09360 [Fredinandcohnia humi]
MGNFSNKKDELNSVQNKSMKELEEEMGLYFLNSKNQDKISTLSDEEEF